MRQEQFDSNAVPERYLSFEEQFAKRETVEVLGEEIEVLDITPENLETITPVLFAPGWGASPEMLKDTLRVFFEKGRRVITLSHTRQNLDLSHINEETRNKYPAEELEKALVLDAILDEKGIESVRSADVSEYSEKGIDVIGYSEGGINAVIGASLNTDRIRSLNLLNPGGLTGSDKLPKLAGRFTVSGIQDALGATKFEKSRVTKAGIEITKFIAKNPMKALRDATAIAGSDVRTTLKELHDQGVRVGVMAGVDDPVFPMERMQENADVDQLDGFVSIKGGHGKILYDPERWVPAALALSNSLAYKGEVPYNEY